MMFNFQPNTNFHTRPIKDITKINIKVGQYLLERTSFDINTLLNDEYLPVRQPTLLHVAIWNSDTQLFYYLLSKGANIYTSFETYGSALHLAVYRATEDLSIIIQLIVRGAQINSYEFLKQWTPLHIACSLGRCDIVRLLINQGAVINPTDPSLRPGNSPLYVAIEHNKTNVVEILCAKNANVNSVSADRGTPLLFAVANGNYDIARILIHYGANVNYISNIRGDTLKNPMFDKEKSYQLTPLHVAIIFQNESLVELLLNCKAAVHLSIDRFRTPLFCAVTGTNTKIVTLLLNFGANFSNTTLSERQLIQNCIRTNHQSIQTINPMKRKVTPVNMYYTNNNYYN